MINKTISQFVRDQFPEFYHQEGPVFVAFVEEYYKWLETSFPVANQTFLDTKKNSYLTVTAGSPNVVLNDLYSNLQTIFSNGDTVAIYNTDDNDSLVEYDTFTINTVSNSTHLTLNSDRLPTFSSVNSRYSTTFTQYNPLHYSRYFYDNQDVDETVSDFLVYFKEKYLKNIRFETEVDMRRIIKHATDIYRSKGTERGADLLFRIVFGTGAKVYYPGDDVFRLSSGKWRVPKYLELNLKETNTQLVGKQIEGVLSGATAFVEAIIRKTVNGILLDVAYVSSVNGNFQTGEKIFVQDGTQDVINRATIIGSLSNLVLPTSGTGFGYSVGDTIQFSSVYGSGGRARVSAISNTTGVIDVELESGGYGFSNTAEVLVSKKNLVLTDVSFDHTSYSNEYLPFFDTLIQPAALIGYTNCSADLNVGDEIFSYHANNDVKGRARILTVSGNTTDGNIFVSIISGNVDHDPIYTTSNVAVSNVSSYTDQTAKANVVAYSDSVNVSISSVSGDFQVGELIYQTHPTSNLIQTSGYLDTVSPSLMITSNVAGVWRPSWTIRGSISGATATAGLSSLSVGIKDIRGAFFSTQNNYFYTLNSSCNGTINTVSQGENFSVGISSNLQYTENVSVYTDRLIDLWNMPLTLTTLTGTALVNASSNVIVGTGTDFANEIRFSVTGNVSINSTANVIVGTGTDFVTEVQAGDILNIANNLYRVRDIVNSTYMYINGHPASAVSNTANIENYVIFTGGGNREARRISGVTNATHIQLASNCSFNNASASMEFSWGATGNLEANSTCVFDDRLTTANVTIGRVRSLANINLGNNYTSPMPVRILEPNVISFNRSDYLLEIANLSSSFEVGELVTQSGVSARGLVLDANATHISILNMRLENTKSFTQTSNSTLYLEGENSGATANITAIHETHESRHHSEHMGFNAVVSTFVSSANGIIASLEITDSGFGFKNNESIVVLNASSPLNITTSLSKQGTGTGYYADKNGFLSNDKKLFDGIYYQDYSYEIRSSVVLMKYEEMLKKLIHVSGTKHFGALYYSSLANTEISAQTSIITSS